jgi:hypothetical protein
VTNFLPARRPPLAAQAAFALHGRRERGLIGGGGGCAGHRSKSSPAHQFLLPRNQFRRRLRDRRSLLFNRHPSHLSTLAVQHADLKTTITVYQLPARAPLRWPRHFSSRPRPKRTPVRSHPHFCCQLDRPRGGGVGSGRTLGSKTFASPISSAATADPNSDCRSSGLCCPFASSIRKS